MAIIEWCWTLWHIWLFALQAKYILPTFLIRYLILSYQEIQLCTDIPRLVNWYEGTLANACVLNMFLKAGLLLLFSCIEKSKAENGGECSKVCEHVAILIIFVWEWLNDRPRISPSLGLPSKLIIVVSVWKWIIIQWYPRISSFLGLPSKLINNQ